mgnify:CR=1 FL=1
MAHPYHHALSSVKTWGGAVDDFIAVHAWFDQSKEITADFRHRALRHHAETIVPSGAAAANALGLTTQVPVKSVYLTSGRSRVLNLGRQAVELRHAPRWQLALGNKTSGQAVRALAWLGPDEAPKALQILRSKLTEAAKTELVSAAPQFPTWLARLVGEMVHG